MDTLLQQKRRPANGQKTLSSLPDPATASAIMARMQRFTVHQFLKLVEAGILPSSEKVELLDGLVFHKLTQNPPHATAIQLANRLLTRIMPDGWHIRVQMPLALPQSLPEPDLAVVQGDEHRYAEQHPRPQDVVLAVEVADSTLEEDRDFKGPLYARARLPVYWIINLHESKIEVYSEPRTGRQPRYHRRQDFTVNGEVPVVIDSREIGHIAVRDLIP